MRGQDVEDLLTVLLSAAGFDPVAKHQLLAVVVHPRLEAEAAALAGVRDGPARERARDFLYVLLRVAAVDPERVELHQLACVVLVQPARRSLGVRALRRGRPDALPVIQEK